MTDPHRAFLKAQKEYDNRTPPEAEECPECGEFECEHSDAAEAAMEDYLEMRAEERRHGG